MTSGDMNSDEHGNVKAVLPALKWQGLELDVSESEVMSARCVGCYMQIQGLPTMVFVGTDPNKPALRTEGLLPAHIIKEIIENELMAPEAEAAA